MTLIDAMSILNKVGLKPNHMKWGRHHIVCKWCVAGGKRGHLDFAEASVIDQHIRKPTTFLCDISNYEIKNETSRFLPLNGDGAGGSDRARSSEWANVWDNTSQEDRRCSIGTRIRCVARIRSDNLQGKLAAPQNQLSFRSDTPTELLW